MPTVIATTSGRSLCGQFNGVGVAGGRMDDILRPLGYLCLGSRLKRLGERLQAGVVQLGRQRGLEVQAGQFPILVTIDRLGPVTITDLAEALGVSQPGVTRNVAGLVAAGLVQTRRIHEDQRHKTLTLTKAGRQLVERCKRDFWPRIEAVVAEICRGLSGSLLDQLAGLEDALAESSLESRLGRDGQEAAQ
jgi:DNA-binding MarR family transcriptional regulator